MGSEMCIRDSCIFMFNPFDEVILEKVLENIEQSVFRNPRKITLVYLSNLYDALLNEYGYKRIHHINKLEYLQADIFEST